MSICAVLGCNNGKRKENCRAKTFFRFPFRYPALVEIWIKAIGREHFRPAPSSTLCSDHFEESCFVYQQFTNRRQLKPGSIPTIFNVPDPKSKREVNDTCEASSSKET
ncbi:THAP domain-containing protein 3 [Trichonephila clavata]|uniref:THAP domain-containing protein 3 n=1 Tax=Trichonephila clavata TaxID=2740835 RepID=A0A8X6FDD7_TRICU|nr:THAP domain-containing protein 3 [Trichonephila clavata]